MPPPDERSFAGGAALTTVAQALSVIAGGLVSVAIARTAGPAGAGVCAVALTAFGLLLAVANLGVGLGTAWQVGGGTWEPRSAALTTQASGVALGLIAGALGLAVLAGIGGSLTEGISVPALCVLTVTLPFALVWTNAANVAVAARSYRTSLMLTGTQTSAYVLGVIVLGGAASVDGVLWTLLASHALAATVSLAWGARLPRGVHRSIDGGRFRLAVSFGSLPWAGRVLALAVQRGDLLVLGATATRAEVGGYAIAVAVTTPLWVLPSGVAAVLLPRTAALLAAGEAASAAAIEARALRHAVLVLVTGAAALAGGIVLLLTTIFGAGFARAEFPAVLLLPGTIAAGLTQVMRSALAGRGEPRAVLATWAGTLPLAAILYAALIPPYGATGAAVASTLAYALAAMLSGRLLTRASGQATHRRLIPGPAEVEDWRRLLGAAHPR